MSLFVLHYCGLYIFLDIIYVGIFWCKSYGFCRILEIICTLYSYTHLQCLKQNNRRMSSVHALEQVFLIFIKHGSFPLRCLYF
ncbi:hypothetical protein NC651_001662 [Populus alba x Populus x berolinensis]|nr:hypothetical protein NC651_001662 [Populus alba x Populus x berolinensis]